MDHKANLKQVTLLLALLGILVFDTNPTAVAVAAESPAPASSSASLDTIDLFVFTRYFEIDENGIASKTPCDGCFDLNTSDTDSKLQCSFVRGFLPTNVCYQYLRGYDRYEYVAENNTMLLTTYDDNDSCTTNTSIAWTGEVEFDSCTTTSSFQQERLENFCIKSTTPVNEYQYPLVQQLTFDNINQCQGHSNSSDDDFRVLPDWYIVNDPSIVCAPSSIDTDLGTRTHGGYVVSCDADAQNALTIQYYTAPTCTVQDNTLTNDRIDHVIKEGTCTELPPTTSSSGSTILPFARVDGCETPTIFCKSLATTDYVLSKVTTTADAVENEASSSSSHRWRSSNCADGCIIFLILLCTIAISIVNIR